MVKTIRFDEFMSGEYKTKKKRQRKNTLKKSTKIASSTLFPIAAGAAGTMSFIHSASAHSTLAVEASAKQWMGEQTLSALAHVLDPVVDILVALSFPVASVVIVGACFFFIFGNAEKAWGMIQNAGLGYVLIQVSPLILNVLKQVGYAV